MQHIMKSQFSNSLKLATNHLLVSHQMGTTEKSQLR